MPYIKNIAVSVFMLVIVGLILFGVLKDRPIIQLSFAEQTGVMVRDEVGDAHYRISTALSNSRVASTGQDLWVSDCPAGSCVYFDGYANSFEIPGTKLAEVDRGLSLQVWVAPQFLATLDAEAPMVVVSHYTENTHLGVELIVAQGGYWGLNLGTGVMRIQVLTKTDPLVEGKWAHLTASYDQETQSVRLYQNGQELVSEVLSAPIIFAPATLDIQVGRSATADTVDGLFSPSSFAGKIDELRVYDFALTEDGSAGDYQLAAAQAKGDASATPQRITENRPVYHALSAQGWVGQPFAPLYHEGQYHLFFMTNPRAPFDRAKSWGHWTSQDMVRWQEQVLAQTPSEKAPYGLGRGSATFDAQGKPVILHAIHANAPSEFGHIALSSARDETLLDWQIDNPAVIVQEANQGVKGHFNAPHVYRDGDHWIALVASQTRDRQGILLTYKSSDLLAWEYQGIAFARPEDKSINLGYDWVASTLLPLPKGKKKHTHVLAVVSRNYYGDRDTTHYWLGRWDQKKAEFIPAHEEGRKLTVAHEEVRGFAGLVTSDKRSVLFYFSADETSPQQRYQYGRSNHLSLPLSLSLRSKQLNLAPIAEVANLRTKSLVDLKNTTLKQVRQAVRDHPTSSFEIDMTVDMADVDKGFVGVRFNQSEKRNAEYTLVSWDKSRGFIVMQRNKSSIDKDTPSQGNIGVTRDKVGRKTSVRIFVDHSSVEAFFDSEKIMIGHSYPIRPSSNVIDLLGASTVKIDHFKLWELASATPVQTTPIEYVIPSEDWVWTSKLENHNFRSCDLAGWQDISGDAFVAQGASTRSHYANRTNALFNPSRRVPGVCHYSGATVPNKDGAVGQMYSAEFTMAESGAQLNFLISGGRDSQNLYVALIDAGTEEVLRRATGNNHETYRRVYWSLGEYLNRPLQLQIVDNSTTGHLNFDHFNLSEPSPVNPVINPTNSTN